MQTCECGKKLVKLSQWQGMALLQCEDCQTQYTLKQEVEGVKLEKRKRKRA